MQLLPDQVALVSTIVTVLISVLTIGWTGILKRPKPAKDVLKTVVFVGSVVLAWNWAPFSLPNLSGIPPIADGLMPFVYAVLEVGTSVLAAAVLVMKVAQQIYDKAWQRILTWLDANVVSKLNGGPATSFLMPKR